MSLAFVFSGGSAAAAEIRFKEKANATRAFVALGDIADVKAAAEKEAIFLRNIFLFPAPAQGQSRTVRSTDLCQLLKLHGVDLKQYRFSGAGEVQIVGAAPDVVRSTAVIPDSGEPQFEIVCAKLPIAAGEIIREVSVELRRSEKRPSTAIPVLIQSVVGQEALRDFSPGQPLDLRSIRKPILIERGQAVTVIAKAAGVQVRTTARALESGSHGDLVLVESLENRQEYSAMVSGPQQAEVLASSAIIPQPARPLPIGQLKQNPDPAAQVSSTARREMASTAKESKE